MRGGLTAALVVLVVGFPCAQNSWDLTKCRAAAPAGHLCTPEHLETDLALLTAREIAKFLDPESQALELLIRRDPQTHIRNPEASLPDPRTDPTFIQLLHAWAESGRIESESAARQVAAGPTALKGIKRISVTVGDSDSKDGKCRPTNEELRRAAARPIIDGGIKLVSDNIASPVLYVNLTALTTSTDGCAAFLSVSLRDLPYPTPGYHQPPKALGRKVLEDGSLLTSPRPAFAERVTDQLGRTVNGFITQIKLANGTR